MSTSPRGCRSSPPRSRRSRAWRPSRPPPTRTPSRARSTTRWRATATTSAGRARRPPPATPGTRAWPRSRRRSRRCADASVVICLDALQDSRPMTPQRTGWRAVARPFVDAIRRGRRAYDRLRWERGLEGLEEWVHPDGLDDNPERTRYEASSYGALQRALRGEKIGPEHVFIDYGSGKGR